jgi:hypothetical protein
MNEKEIAIVFANWLSENYQSDYKIGQWTDFDEENTVYTTEQLWELFVKTKLRKLKIDKLK